MATSPGSCYAAVQGLSRGLSVLFALSQSAQGRAGVVELGQATGLHRTTVRRLLETLHADGWVHRSPSDGSYRLNRKVRLLAEGFTDDDWISEVATPVLGELLQKIVWPSDLCTLDGDAMLVRETTHRFSPLSFHRGMVWRRMPILFTSVGRAYLAFCPDEERRAILGLLERGDDDQAALARIPGLVEQMLARIRQQGYAANEGDWRAEQKIGAIAVPIRHGPKVLGCLNAVFLRKAMPIETAAQRYLPALRDAVAKIESRLQTHGQASAAAVDGGTAGVGVPRAIA